MTFNLRAKTAAEFFGTAFLVAAVIGSGIMGERLAGGNVGLALLANTLATGAILMALIISLGPISGAHFNPAVTLVMAWKKALGRREAICYLAAQLAGAFAGAIAAHLMFAVPVLSISTHARRGPAQWWSEFVATFGLLLVIRASARFHPSLSAVVVGTYITAAYWFTASTSFANPAVTLARAASNTFAGIRPVDVPAFVMAQLAGAFAAAAFFQWIMANETPRLEETTAAPTRQAARTAERKSAR
jgi:glycerol uptake facilitator-like aquaporin